MPIAWVVSKGTAATRVAEEFGSLFAHTTWTLLGPCQALNISASSFITSSISTLSMSSEPAFSSSKLVENPGSRICAFCTKLTPFFNENAISWVHKQKVTSHPCSDSEFGEVMPIKVTKHPCTNAASTNSAFSGRLSPNSALPTKDSAPFCRKLKTSNPREPTAATNIIPSCASPSKGRAGRIERTHPNALSEYPSIRPTFWRIPDAFLS
mmetsp:Transcript_29954/g.39381  ORF Transcript_29954/g.39381 Transcript_29954/m.39381 type:complete len:210 (+) Transcript_29954:779-1408(+)